MTTPLDRLLNGVQWQPVTTEGTVYQDAIDALKACGLTATRLVEIDGGFIATCTPTEWRQAYADRLLKRGWYTVRFGQHIKYAGNVGRIASTEIELERIGK